MPARRATSPSQLTREFTDASCGATATSAATAPQASPATSSPAFSTTSSAARYRRPKPVASIKANSRRRSSALRSSTTTSPTVPSSRPSPPSARNVIRYVFCTPMRSFRISRVPRTSTPALPRFRRSDAATASSRPGGVSIRKKRGAASDGNIERKLSSETSSSLASMLPESSPAMRRATGLPDSSGTSTVRPRSL